MTEDLPFNEAMERLQHTLQLMVETYCLRFALWSPKVIVLPVTERRPFCVVVELNDGRKARFRVTTCHQEGGYMYILDAKGDGALKVWGDVVQQAAFEN